MQLSSLAHLDADICKSVLAEYRIHNADVRVMEDSTVDEFIDIIEGNRYGWGSSAVDGHSLCAFAHCPSLGPAQSIGMLCRLLRKSARPSS